MDPKDFIEPSLADAPALQTQVRNGRLVYVVHGICTVTTLDDALALIEDRRIAPRQADASVFACCGGVTEKPAGVHGVLDGFSWELA